MKMGFLLALVGWAIGFAAPTFVQTFVQLFNRPTRLTHNYAKG
jgi:hypothetical protein